MISKIVICAVVCFILGVMTGLSHESSDKHQINTKTKSSANTPNAS